MTSIIDLGTVLLDARTFAAQGNAVLGIRGSGKTYLSTLLGERLMDVSIPFVAFDPIGVWRFLRVPGKGAGYPVVVAGGEHGDLPLTPEGAPEIVRAAMREGVSLVIDLYSMGLSKADWRRIVERCVRVLLYENKAHGLRHVFIEEAAEFAPQQVGRDYGTVYAEVEKLARMGGNALLGYTLISQRAEQVNKAVLELCDALFLFRQKGRLSLTALSKWLDIGGAKGGAALAESLPTLPQGVCWAWLGGDDTPIRVEVPEKRTLSPDRSKLHGVSIQAVAGRGAVDVGSFVSKMQGSLEKIVAEAKANDPKALKAEVVRLKADVQRLADIRNAHADPDPAAIAAAEERGYQRALEKGHTALLAYWAELEEVRADFIAAMEGFRSLQDKFVDASGPGAVFEPPTNEIAKSYAPPSGTAKPTPNYSDPMPATTPPRAKGTALKPVPRQSDSSKPRLSGAGFNSAAGKMLAVMDTNPPVKRTWQQVATLAGLKARGGHFNAGRKSLIDSRLVIEEGGLVRVTIPSADATEAATDPAVLVDMWSKALSGAAPKILQRLFYRMDGSMERTALAEALNMQPRGGHWNAAWKELRDNGIVTIEGNVARLTDLFRS